MTPIVNKRPVLVRSFPAYGNTRPPLSCVTSAALSSLSDPAARQRLNAITHPRIRARMDTEVAARRQRSGVLILDIPLLYENGRAGIVEKVIVVWVDPRTQLQRLTKRDGLSVGDARQRIAAQMSLDDKRARADYVIDNTGSREATRRQVEAIYRPLTMNDR